VNGILSSGFPSVHVAVKYLQNLDEDGIIGGRPHTITPGRYNGTQISDIGTQNNVVMHCNKMVLEALKILGLNGRSSATLFSLYSCTPFISFLDDIGADNE